MKRETVLALSAINRAFYAASAAEFSETRAYAWPGFSRVLSLVPPPAEGPFRVLDVGAGDGRFAAFLKGAIAPPPPGFAYLGVDSSQPLLATARARALGSAYRFESCDFVIDAAALPRGPFELTVLFGVLHHVPSFALRRALIAQLARGTDTLVLTFWRLDRDPRFASRVRSFAHYNATAPAPIAEADLEPGDTLLSWGAQGDAFRYCHFPDASETRALIASAGLPVVARFDADGRGGRLNEYVIFSRRC